MTVITDIERQGRIADRACFDAIKHMLGTVDDPRGYALWLVTEAPHLAQALRAATRGQSAAERGYWIITDDALRPKLMRLGLVPARERHLSNYGAAVRKQLMGEDD